MTVPEPHKIKELDFSQFHPLDHPLWRCWGYHGGWRTHLRYRWDFQWSYRIEELLYCRRGVHRRYGDAWRGEEYLGKRCCTCHEPQTRVRGK